MHLELRLVFQFLVAQVTEVEVDHAVVEKLLWGQAGKVLGGDRHTVARGIDGVYSLERGPRMSKQMENNDVRLCRLTFWVSGA